MYKLTDGDGRLIVLRPDNTAPIARLVCSKLHAESFPLLIRYDQRVFRSSAAYNALRNEVLPGRGGGHRRRSAERGPARSFYGV